MRPVEISLDKPLQFEPTKCRLCYNVDTDWCCMHFLADGMWRKLVNGQTPRSQGIDKVFDARIYVIHGCCESVFRTLVTLREIDAFFSSVKGRL